MVGLWIEPTQISTKLSTFFMGAIQYYNGNLVGHEIYFIAVVFFIEVSAE